MSAVDTERTLIALGKIEGFPFERFVNEFYSALRGHHFIPLGGNKDGGADGFETYVSSDTSGKIFVQSSIRVDVTTKVKDTIESLRKVGRIPVSLTYVCAKPIQSIDILESKLTKEHDVTIMIRDGNYIANHINSSPATQVSYWKHLHQLNESLDKLGASTIFSPSMHASDPSVIVFLSNEMERRSGSHSLVHSVIDSLILWALEETDPKKNILMSETDVLTKILSVLPSVEALVKPLLNRRLLELSAKKEGGDRAIRTYKKAKLFCLPFATRKTLQEENVGDETLRTQVETHIEERINLIQESKLSELEVQKAKQAVIRTLQITFEKQGLAFTASLHDGLSNEMIVVADSIGQALDETNANGKSRETIGRVVLECLKGVLYESASFERDYLHKLSRTYSLLFTLELEPKLISFFEQMTGDFYLYVGTDQLVQALSERYLQESDRTVTNTLKMAAAAGARLILTEPTLDEVANNIRTSDLEFKHYISNIEASVTYEIARNSPKILVRAYLYARLRLGTKEKPASWQGFVNQICNYSDLYKNEVLDSIKRYLIREYSMEFKTREELFNLVNVEEFTKLSDAIKARGSKTEILVDNDVLTTLSVYGHRRRKNESSSTSDFGYQTWWLTNETRILDYTRELVEAQGGKKFIMRPDFLLNFLTLAPSASAARESFASIFPSLLGITLSRRLPEAEFRKLLSQTAEASELSPSRRSAEIANLSDKLKGDQYKKYLSSGTDGNPIHGVDAIAKSHVAESDE